MKPIWRRRTLALVLGILSLTAPLLAQEGSRPTPTTSEPTASEPAAEEIQALEGDALAGSSDESPALKLMNKTLNTSLGAVNSFVSSSIFFDVSFGAFHAPEFENGEVVLDQTGAPKMKVIPIPFIVALLAIGGVLFSAYYRFVNITGFKHAIDIVRGKFDHETDIGEISHFRALTSALSATVGLGNIAGVAIAIQLGGPGAVFWMFLAAFFGMATKFSSCTLAQLYRKKNEDGSFSGGPMYYLDLGLKNRNPLIKWIGKSLALLYGVMIMVGSMGGGNMFQSNQSFEALHTAFGVDQKSSWIFGLLMALAVGVVILGGIRRIGAATSRIVPLMVGTYILAAIAVLGANFSQIPLAVSLIFAKAFSANAAYGGAIGVLVWGVTRASFSNEAGLGSAAIAHAAAKTDEPVREGLVAMLGPFIDTMIVCMTTALVVIVSGAWNDPSIPQEAGVSLTTAAFATVLPWFPKVLAICVLLFAYSTMISWCYYGERGWIYIMDHFNGRGVATVGVFRVIFVCFVFIGAVAKLEAVLDFSDLLILCMAFPNLIGSAFLAPRIKAALADYWNRVRPAHQAAAAQNPGQ
ncbi:MAG: alanine:cation symporter family protein [Polyangiaceae bacterium]|nr:alanine:cation symporter family protein [Polyangiaceae bacterium]